jgi:hypothetical protein
MKVAFNARLLALPRLDGWNRYTLNLLRELAGLGVEICLYSDRPLFAAHADRLPGSGSRVRLAPAMPYWRWQHWWVPQQCAADGVHLFHTPFNYGLPWSSPCPRVLTLHDAIPQAYSARGDGWGKRFQPLYLKSRLHSWIARSRADHIITVSQHAKSDLIRHLGIPPGKITVVYGAADPRFLEPLSRSARRRIREKYGLLRPYIFCLGASDRRKNVPFLMRAFASARPAGTELAVGGQEERNRGLELEETARSEGIQDRTRFLGPVDDADLPGLYAEALCFVYPSEYEGFGLPLCEAMALGCPVLAAQSSSIPEVLGSGGETFPTSAPDTLAALLGRVATNPTYRAHLACRAQARSRDFSWRTAAIQTLEVYRGLLEQKT